MRKPYSALSLLCLALMLATVMPAHAAPPAQSAGDWALANGHFFTQAAGGQGGFAVVDDGTARFWSEFQHLGGLQTVGYPISQRFSYDGFVTQAFQKLVLQWRPVVNQSWPLNVFDELSKKGHDEWLLRVRQTPYPLANFDPAGASWAQIVANRQALLDTNPAIRARYYAAPDPLTVFGLPVSRVEDMGNHHALRTQRVVFQQWKEAVPWAAQGQVTIANGGDLLKEARIIPAAALVPTSDTSAPPPPPGPDPGTPMPAGSHDWRAPGYVAAVHGRIYDTDCRPLRSVGINVPNLLYRTGQKETLEWMHQHGLRWMRVFATSHGLGSGLAPPDETHAAEALGSFLDMVEAFNARHPDEEAIYVLVSLTSYYPPGVPGDSHAFDHPTFRGTPVLPAPWFRAGVRHFDFEQEHFQGVKQDMPNYEVHYKPWVEEIVASAAQSPALMGWQLGNELKARGSPRNGFNSAQAYDWYLAFTRDMVDTIRSRDRQHLIVTGAQYIAELVDWEYRPQGAPLPQLTSQYRSLVDRMLAACDSYCWNVWGLTIYDFNPYPLDDARLFAEAGVASIATEHGITLGSMEGLDRATAIGAGIDQSWHTLSGQSEPRLWSARELVENAPLAAIAPWGSPAPGLGANFDTDMERGITGTPDEDQLWAAWTAVASGLEDANRATPPSQACLAERSP